MHLRFADRALCASMDAYNECSPHNISGNVFWKMDQTNCTIDDMRVRCDDICTSKMCPLIVEATLDTPRSTVLILHDDAADAAQHSPVGVSMGLGGMFYAVGGVSYITEMNHGMSVGFFYTWPEPFR